MNRRMIDRQQVPWSLWAFSGVWLVNALVIDVTVSAPVASLLLLPIFALGVSYFLLRQIRWLWFAVILIHIASVLEILTGSETWLGSVSTVVGLVLLLVPTTREYFAKQPKCGSS